MMKKEDLLQEKIEKILLDIDFICQYQNLSDTFTNSGSEFRYTSEQVQEISEENGVALKVYEGDQYFSDFEKVGESEFRIGMTIKFNIVEFDLTIKNESQNISSGGSFGLIVQLLTNWSTRIKKPGFNSYNDLRGLIQEGISIYNNVKNAVVENISHKA